MLNVLKQRKIMYQIFLIFSFWYRCPKGYKGCAKKLNFIQKWPNLQERSGLIWQRFLAQIIFFVRFLVFEIWSILYFSLCNAFRTYGNLKKNRIEDHSLSWLASESGSQIVFFRREDLSLNWLESKSGSQSVTLSPSTLLNTKSIITQKLRIAQKETCGYKNSDENIGHILR